MSCPDWPALCDRRESEAGDGPGWQAALAHLDECPRCQRDAPAADPALLFRRLPVLEADRDGVEAMKSAVASMRRGGRIEQRRGLNRRGLNWHGLNWHGLNRRGAIRRPLLRAAALAAVLLGSMLLRGASVPLPGDADPVLVIGTSSAFADELDLSRLPLVETIDPLYSSIIQVVDDDISLVVVLPMNAADV